MRKGCDTCRYGSFAQKDVYCLHPLRPKDKPVAVKWYTGCAQHSPDENDFELPPKACSLDMSEGCESCQ